MANGIQKMIDRFGGARDMTTGDPAKCLIEFALPLLIGNIAQQLYSTVDSIVVGKYAGDNALGAIGATMPMFNLIFVLFMGISVGAGILVSQYYGAKDKKRLSQTVGNSLIMVAVVSLIIMVVGSIIVRPFMVFLNTPPELYDMAVDYLTILLLGVAGTTYYNILSGILRGIGDSFMPLVFLLVCTIINTILDIILVGPMHLGVTGAALATVLAQIISSILCYLRIAKMKGTFTLDREAFRVDFRLIKHLLVLGIPTGVTQMIFSLASIMVQSLTNNFGAMIVTVNSIIMRVDGFAMMPNFTFGSTMTTYAGQNVGALKIKRLHDGTREGMKMSLVVSTVLVAVILLIGKLLMGLFTNTQEIIDYAYHMMCILAAGYIGMAVTQMLSGVMRGAGDTMTPMWISIITTVVIRVPLAYLMAYMTRSEAYPNGDPKTLFISLLISWIAGAVLTAVLYMRRGWAKHARVGGNVIDISQMGDAE